jgi:predicted transcriptional regulator
MSIFGSLRATQLISKIDTLGDLDSPEAEKVVTQLRKTGTSAIRRITGALDGADGREFSALVDLLARLITDKTLPEIRKALSSDSQRVVGGVVQALRKGRGYNPNRLIDMFKRREIPNAALCEALSGQKERLDLRRVLTQAYLLESTEKAALFRIVAEAATEKDVPEVISRLSGKDVVARAHMIDILSRFDLPEVHTALEGQLRD